MTSITVSIGPRPFRHGNREAKNGKLQGIVRFQLGHVLSDMEIWFMDKGVYYDIKFQLGHVLSDMEMVIVRSVAIPDPPFQLGHVLSDMEIWHISSVTNA